jgi:glycosyltransferase involved in cell wall biosynthesis
MGNQKLTIVVPVYNEERTITNILDKINEVTLIQGITKEIICVNDCSKDKSKDIILAYIAQHPDRGIVLFNHEVNQGKGAALHTGISKATGRLGRGPRC